MRSLGPPPPITSLPVPYQVCLGIDLVATGLLLMAFLRRRGRPSSPPLGPSVPYLGVHDSAALTLTLAALFAFAVLFSGEHLEYLLGEWATVSIRWTALLAALLLVANAVWVLNQRRRLASPPEEAQEDLLFRRLWFPPLAVMAGSLALILADLLKGGWRPF